MPSSFFSDGVAVALVTGLFGLIALVPAFIINRGNARKDAFEAAQRANQQNYDNLQKMYHAVVKANDELSKRIDSVVKENERLAQENLRLQQRNDKLEDENRGLIKEIATVKAANKELTNRVDKLEATEI